jgi:hypothetical protein
MKKSKGIIMHKESKHSSGKLISSKLKHELRLNFNKMITIDNHTMKSAIDHLSFINGLSYGQVYTIVS